MKYYLLCQCGTTPITHAVLLLFFFLLLQPLPASSTLGDFFFVAPEDTGNMMEVNELTCRQVLLTPMTAKADGDVFIMDGFVRRKGRADYGMKADGGRALPNSYGETQKYGEDYWEVDAKELNLHYESLI